MRLYNIYGDKLLVLTTKGEFPYDCMDSECFNKLKEKELPELNYWLSKLNHDDITDEKTINKVRKEKDYVDFILKCLKCKTIKDYNNLYVTTDVLLLSDVFTDYRQRSYELFKIDPIYSVSLLGFSNRAMLIILVQKLNYLLIEICIQWFKKE